MRRMAGNYRTFWKLFIDSAADPILLHTGPGGPGRGRSSRTTTAMMARTSNKCSQPPSVYELINPMSHKMNKIIASVNNIIWTPLRPGIEWRLGRRNGADAVAGGSLEVAG